MTHNYTKTISRILMPLLFVLLSTLGLRAQVAVTVTGNNNTTPNLAASYPSLSSAITDLNAITAIGGSVTFTCAASGSETAPVGGYTISPAVSTTAAKFIVFDGNGSTITAGLQTAGNVNDAVFKIVGADFVTLTNFTMLENSGNTITTVASNTMTE